MTDDFRTPPQELQRLLEQIADLKATLREVSGKLTRIEQHVKRAFSVPKAPTGQRETKAGQGAPASLSAAKAQEVFDELPPLLETGGREAVEKRLGLLEVADLKVIAQELGAPLPKHHSRKTLGDAIIQRATESQMLSRNRNVTSPKSESMSTDDAQHQAKNR